MVKQEKKFTGPDLIQGIALDELADGGMLVRHAGDEQILLVGRAVRELDVRARQVVLAGEAIPYDRLLLATGAEPIRLTIAGANQPHVRTLRSLADCQTIIERAQGGAAVVVIGASFIGLEVAAALRTRNLEVHVVAPDKRPMERILGPDMGNFVRALHDEHGVILHLKNKVAAIDEKNVRLEKGGRD